MHARMGNLDGVMVGQAAIGRPWIFTNHSPTLEERYETIVRHAQMMIIIFDYYFANRELGRAIKMPTYDWLNNEIRIFDASKYSHEKTMIEYRKYLFNYISGLPGNRELKVQLASTKDYTTTI
jgi:tRNA-dihydrouridine synthase